MIQLFKATRGNVEKIIRLHMFTVIEDMKSRPVLSAVANQKTKTLQIGDQKFEVCDTFLHPPKLLSLFLCVCARVYVCTYIVFDVSQSTCFDTHVRMPHEEEEERERPRQMRVILR